MKKKIKKKNREKNRAGAANAGFKKYAGWLSLDLEAIFSTVFLFFSWLCFGKYIRNRFPARGDSSSVMRRGISRTFRCSNGKKFAR
jgi:hypothetical protein